MNRARERAQRSARNADANNRKSPSPQHNQTGEVHSPVISHPLPSLPAPLSIPPAPPTPVDRKGHNTPGARFPSQALSPNGSPDGLPAGYTEESPLIVDNTILGTVATCHTKALIAYHHNLVSPTDSTSLILGSATHKALELFFKTSDAKSSMSLFQRLYYPTGNLLDPEESLSWENTQTTLETWFAGHSLDSLSFTALPGTIEGAIMTPLWPEQWGKRVLYLGLVDLLIQERATGTLAIMDHKTTAKRLDDSWVGQFKTSAQLSGYIWLAQQTGIHEKLDKAFPISNAYINTIQYSRLPVSDRKCPKHAVSYMICKGLHAVSRLDGPFMRSPLQLEQWLANARSLTLKWAWTREDYPQLGSLRAVPKQGLFAYEACKFCSYTDYCSGTIVDAMRLPQFLKRQEWTPWKTNNPGPQG